MTPQWPWPPPDEFFPTTEFVRWQTICQQGTRPMRGGEQSLNQLLVSRSPSLFEAPRFSFSLYDSRPTATTR